MSAYNTKELNTLTLRRQKWLYRLWRHLTRYGYGKPRRHPKLASQIFYLWWHA